MSQRVQGARAALPAFEEGKGVGIQRIDIQSNKDKGKTVSVINSVMTFQYYESILQYAVRATVSFVDTGNTLDDKTAMEGLPIVGQETVNLKFTDNNNETVELVLYVNSVTPLLDDTRKSIVKLELASREYIWNEKVRSNKRFDGLISNHIEKLLTDKNLYKKTLQYAIESFEHNDDRYLNSLPNKLPKIYNKIQIYYS